MLDTQLKNYLARVGSSSLGSITFEQKKKVFLLAIDEFKAGDLSPDDLTTLAIDLGEAPLHPESDEEELNSAVYAASQLSFYLRKIDSNTSVSQFDIFMVEVLEYYSKHFPS